MKVSNLQINHRCQFSSLRSLTICRVSLDLRTQINLGCISLKGFEIISQVRVSVIDAVDWLKVAIYQ